MKKNPNDFYPCTNAGNTRGTGQQGGNMPMGGFQKARFASEARDPSNHPLSLREYLHQKLPRKHASEKLLQSIRNKIDRGEY